AKSSRQADQNGSNRLKSPTRCAWRWTLVLPQFPKTALWYPMCTRLQLLKRTSRKYNSGDALKLKNCTTRQTVKTRHRIIRSPLHYAQQALPTNNTRQIRVNA